MTLEEVIVWIAKIGAAIGSTVIIITHSKTLVNFIKDVISIPSTIKEIKAELKYNGGSSLKDLISKVENRQSIQEQRLCFVLDATPNIGVFETDETGACTKVSLGYALMAGMSQQDCLVSGWINNIHPEDRDKVYSEWKNAIEHSRPFYLKYRFGTEGNYSEVIGKSTPITSKGKITSWIGVITKIKEK